MRVLHTVEFYHPSVGGAQEVVRQVSEELVRRGHDVTVATTRLSKRDFTNLNGVRIVEFAITGNTVQGVRGDTESYQKFLTSGRFDVMVNYAAQQWTSDLAFPVLSRLPYAKILAPCGFSGLFNPRYAAYFRQAPDILRLYDALIFHSNSGRDVEFARQHGLRKLHIIPNGASSQEFNETARDFRHTYGIPPDVPLLLTVGSHTGLKGHKLAIDGFRRARIGRAVLVIIGNYIGGVGCLPRCWSQAVLTRIRSGGMKRVLLLNCKRQDVVAAYQAADLFVFGSALECSPLVLFEAMASGTAFITVACGNAREITQWSGGGVLVRTQERKDGTVTADPDDIARAIENLIQNASRRAALGQAGHQSWVGGFTWQHIVDQYERLYQECVSYTSV